MAVNCAAQKHGVGGILVDAGRDNLVCAVVWRERRPIGRACAPCRQARQYLGCCYLVAHASEISGETPAVVLSPQSTGVANGDN